jgi:hypothetical protein
MQVGEGQDGASPLARGHASAGAAGNSTRNVEPSPTLLWTVMLAPWAVTIEWMMGSPLYHVRGHAYPVVDHLDAGHARATRPEPDDDFTLPAPGHGLGGASSDSARDLDARLHAPGPVPAPEHPRESSRPGVMVCPVAMSRFTSRYPSSPSSRSNDPPRFVGVLLWREERMSGGALEMSTIIEHFQAEREPALFWCLDIPIRQGNSRVEKSVSRMSPGARESESASQWA